MPAIRALLAALLFAAAGFVTPTGATSANTDLSDIWWNSNESGWGMQIVNTGTFAFATIYVYGPNGSPTWYTGQLNATGGAQITYTGPLYATTGPYFGSGSFNPNAVTARQVGTMTFILDTVNSGRLAYSVDGVPVNKTVQRQPLTLDNYTGTYVGILTETYTGCLNSADNGSATNPVAIRITHSGSSLTLVSANTDGSSCTYLGTYSQLGRMGQVAGTYSCTWGEIGTASFFQMNNAPFMFTARLQTQSPNFGCISSGEFAGVTPRQ